ncbi:SAM-dependent methyltransferase [Candidatus Scalindua japonica]|uniref:SAM-dependent methyltransferase n=1 Tax=Candidatus Scalindua japonica TaxID=1284222 RepID=A0A286TZS5_9BACT|nr:class I SAM-dependent methyltransferase [Candidatus Scalindua japonica]GAX61311.1 SAM-dependent methyltransferase [Candidatus Scalindua japonica]
MFKEFEKINSRPTPFQFYTADALWTDNHTSSKILESDLNEDIEVSIQNREFINRSIGWIVTRFGIVKNSLVADFGCGMGSYATRLAEKGADVTGIDFSERFIQHAKGVAKQKGLAIKYVQQNYLEFETEERFDLITLLLCDFCALNPSQRKTMLKKFYTFLNPGGSVLLDVYSMNAFDQREETEKYEHCRLDGFWSPENYYCFQNILKYDEEKVVLDKYTIIEEKRTRIVYNWLQYYSKDSLKKEFEESGFTVEGFYSDLIGTPISPESLEIVIIAKKP